jgi:hypothetical protein
MVEGTDADMYKISLSIAEAVTFYESAFGDAGWNKTASPPIAEGMAVLVFEKDGKTATVVINGMLSPETPMVVVFVQ